MKLPQTWVIKPTFQSSWVSYSHQKFVFDGCVYDFFRAQIARRQTEKKKNIQYTKCLPVLSVGRETKKKSIFMNYRVGWHLDELIIGIKLNRMTFCAFS